MSLLPKLNPSGSAVNVGCSLCSYLPQDWGVSNWQSLLYSHLRLIEINVNLLAKIFFGSCTCSHKLQNSNIVTSYCFCQYICSADGEGDRTLALLIPLPSLMSLCSVDYFLFPIPKSIYCSYLLYFVAFWIMDLLSFLVNKLQMVFGQQEALVGNLRKLESNRREDYSPQQLCLL